MLRVLLIRSDTLTCSFECERWSDFAIRAREEILRQDEYVQEGVSEVEYVRVFVSDMGGPMVLREFSVRKLRRQILLEVTA